MKCRSKGTKALLVKGLAANIIKRCYRQPPGESQPSQITDSRGSCDRSPVNLRSKRARPAAGEGWRDAPAAAAGEGPCGRVEKAENCHTKGWRASRKPKLIPNPKTKTVGRGRVRAAENPWDNQGLQPRSQRLQFGPSGHDPVGTKFPAPGVSVWGRHGPVQVGLLQSCPVVPAPPVPARH